MRGTWAGVLGASEAVRGQCLAGRGRVGWADVEGGGGQKGGVVVVLPGGSAMARKWAEMGWGVVGVDGEGVGWEGGGGGGGGGGSVWGKVGYGRFRRGSIY